MRLSDVGDCWIAGGLLMAMATGRDIFYLALLPYSSVGNLLSACELRGRTCLVRGSDPYLNLMISEL